MIDNETNACAQAGDIAELISAQNKRFIFRLVQDGKFETHRGYLSHNDLIGQQWGTRVFTHMGSPFVLLQPSLSDILVETRRNTQIMYPKDIGFILISMDIGPGRHVLEAGTGSGSFTTALAYAVGPQGKVISYEARPEFQHLAHKNLDRLGLADRVEFKLRDVVEGFDETNVDAVFLDLPNPQDYVLQAKQALKPGGHLGSILPTTNQVSTFLISLRRANFAFIEVCEILLRYYKAVADRLRPTDRMVAHTGYLIFARSVVTEAGEQVESNGEALSGEQINMDQPAG
ncbi:MAG: tRNA (adenine-N1)-methyltransferase [Anaerolineales bacterium]|nr:tRNA (adenine-N1)-methyltransferase [Anaerolineae bacterium]PWB53068.1 MAG: tRNA (adenine-N1)-methyltransferase [Anaerolineales bacterium]